MLWGIIRSSRARFVSFVAALLLLSTVLVLIERSATEAVVTVRGAYGGPSSDIQAAGFNTVNAGASRSTLDSLQAIGLKAVIWLGNYSNSSCTFSKSDATLISDVQAIAGHPAIAAWQISDEPKATSCPGAAQQHRDRTALIHQYDARPTYTVISTWDGDDAYPYEKFAGATDIMGLDVYTCRYNSTTCSFSMIDTAIANADADGVPRYWAVIQAFGDDYYRMPTATELGEITRRWSVSRMEGYFAYHWSQQASWMVDWLAGHPDAVDVMRAFNGGTTPVINPTPTVRDTRPPGRPRYLRARWRGSRVLLTWRSARDNVGVAYYRVYRDGRYIGRTSGLRLYVRASTRRSHRFAVRAVDRARNRSRYSWVSIRRR